jgi:hypothetical protein
MLGFVGSTTFGESLKDQRMGELRTAHFALSNGGP